MQPCGTFGCTIVSIDVRDPILPDTQDARLRWNMTADVSITPK